MISFRSGKRPLIPIRKIEFRVGRFGEKVVKKVEEEGEKNNIVQ